MPKSNPVSTKSLLGKDGFGSKIVTMQVARRQAASVSPAVRWPAGIHVAQMCEVRRSGRSFECTRVEEYELELWRYGAEKEFIRRIGTFDEHGPRATMQITPDGDYTQTGVEWNKHGYHSKGLGQFLEAPQRMWTVLPARSQQVRSVLQLSLGGRSPNAAVKSGRAGVGHQLERLQQFRRTQQLHSCRPFSSHADHQLSSGTQAVHRSSSPHVRHRRRISRCRSIESDIYNHIDEHEGLTDPIAGRQGCHLAAAEWRLLGWMERKGFDYDFYSETQFHFDQVPLDDYRVLIISTHPEYWSVAMYDRLKSWVFERGGRLMYLGGNGLNCEVEFLDDHRIVYQNTNWSHSEPQFAADGREYESRFDKRQRIGSQPAGSCLSRLPAS